MFELFFGRDARGLRRTFASPPQGLQACGFAVFPSLADLTEGADFCGIPQTARNVRQLAELRPTQEEKRPWLRTKIPTPTAAVRNSF
jgi:hypothetical protein